MKGFAVECSRRISFGAGKLLPKFNEYVIPITAKT